VLNLVTSAEVDVPFIVLCDRDDVENALSIMASGAHDVVPRDDLARLVPVVARELGQREVRRARIHAEEALRESVLQYRALFDASTDAIFLEALDGRVLDCNKAACEMFGYTKEEMIRLSVADLVPEEVAAKLPDVITEQLTTGGIFIEAENRKKSGEIFPVAVSTRLIRLGGEEWVVAYVRDITNRQRAEDALRDERRLFIGGATVVFKWRNAEGWPVEYVSPNVKQQFGYDPDDLTSGRVAYAKIVHPDDLLRVAQEVKTYSEEGVPCFEQEYRIVNADGEYRWLYDFTAVVRNARGSITHYHGYILDVTERKRAEAEREVMGQRIVEAKERELMERTNRLTSIGLLAAWVAHEVNNPLQGMLSHLNAVKKELPADFPKAKNVAMVERGIETISALVQKLLELSREPTGKRKTSVCGEALDFVMQLLEPQFRRAKITIVRKEQNPGCRLAIPHREFIQVLLNLFINAKDAMPKGGELTVSSAIEDGLCRITLADTGQGIPKRILGQIFSPFFTTKGTTGTGLGLSVAESIIRHCNGRIDVESEAGKGTRFNLHIPLAKGRKS